MDGLEMDARCANEGQQETYLVIVRVDEIGYSTSAQHLFCMEKLKEPPATCRSLELCLG